MSKTNRPTPIVSSNRPDALTASAQPAEEKSQMDTENIGTVGQTDATPATPDTAAPDTATPATPVIPQPAPDVAPLWDALQAATARRDTATLDVLRNGAQAEIDALIATPALAAYLAERRDATLQPARAALFAAFVSYCDAAGLDSSALYSITRDAIAKTVTTAPTPAGKKAAGGNIGKDTPLAIGEIGWRFVTQRNDGANVAVTIKGIVTHRAADTFRAYKVSRIDGTLTLAPVGATYSSASAANTALAKAVGQSKADAKDIGLNQLWSVTRADAPTLTDIADDVAYVKALADKAQ